MIFWSSGLGIFIIIAGVYATIALMHFALKEKK